MVACVFVAAGTFLPSRCLETHVVSEPSPSNGCFSDSTVLALSKYATILMYTVRTSLSQCVELLLALASRVILVFKCRRDPQPRFLFAPGHVHVQKWGLLFKERRV
jgi:hypothetical protein